MFPEEENLERERKIGRGKEHEEGKGGRGKKDGQREEVRWRGR